MYQPTIGRTNLPGRVVELSLETSDTLDPAKGVFRAILVSRGSGFLNLDGMSCFFEAPCVICLNGNETIVPGRSTEDVVFHCMWFMSELVDAELSRSRVLGSDALDSANPPDWDLYLLTPFLTPRGPEVVIPLGSQNMDHLLELHARLESSLREQPDRFWPCRSRSWFLELLFGIRHASRSEIPGWPHFGVLPERMEAILLFLHSHYQDDLDLGGLCEQFNMNRTSLNEQFRKHTGSSVIQYLISLRVRLAALLLRDTGVPVKELAFRAGFKDPVNFNRTFRRHLGHSPTDYRRMCWSMPGDKVKQG